MREMSKLIMTIVDVLNRTLDKVNEIGHIHFRRYRIGLASYDLKSLKKFSFYSHIWLIYLYHVLYHQEIELITIQDISI